MCTRFFLLQRDYREMLARLGIAAPAAFVTRYNIAPGSLVPGVRVGAPRAGAGGREPVAFQWGIAPRGAEGAAAPVVNARAETLAERPMWREAVRRRRGVLPASGFYEWRRIGRARQPWLFRRRDEAPFALAAIWEETPGGTGGPVAACALVTTTPNELMAPIHERMPVVLSPEQCERWLDPAVGDAAALAPLLRSWPAEAWRAREVSRQVNSVRHDDPRCLAPASVDAEADAAGQLPLGW